MKKRIISAVLVLIMALGIMPTAFADEIKIQGELAYEITDGKATIVACSIDATGVVIPSSIDGYPVTTIGTAAFYGIEKLVSVTVPDSVTVIKDSAFESCVNLKSVTIPDSVQTISGYAFYWCQSLTDITVPVTATIDGAAFKGCEGLKDSNGFVILNNILFDYLGNAENVNIPEGVTSISDLAFYFLENIKSVTIPEGVKSIGEFTFSDCTKLAGVTFADGLEVIGNYAFEGCESLAKIDVPDGVCVIGSGAFEGCGALSQVTIPDSVKSIGNGAFFATAYLNDEKNWQDGVLYNGRHLIKANTDISGDYTIKADTLTLAGDAFYQCKSLASVTIPDGVITIGDDAFYRCKSLVSVTVPDSVTTIGDYAFGGCDKLTDIKLSGSIETIGTYTFYNCKNLERIIIPEVLSIGACAFYGCESLREVYYYGNKSERADIIIGSLNAPVDKANWIYNYGTVPYPHEHGFINDCDTDCDGCDFTREITHDYKPSYDKDNHFDRCTVCGDTITVTAHVFDDLCDTDCICGFTRQPTHTFGDYVFNNDANEKADGTKTRTCSVCGHNETVTAVGTKWTSSFTDIKTKDFYYVPTLWAVANNITTGTSKTAFSPDKPCTRGQVVTFLWRAAGCPEPKTTTMPFTDVKAKAFYKKAVLWAVEQGITSGTSATTFSPDETCTRGQIATFLWRAKGKPAPTSTNMPFNDVAKKDFYYKAVQWAVENKITSGTGKATFAPSEPCTRGQIVTFLYRAYK